MLERAGVRGLTADEAKTLCGLSEAGLFLPYHALDGAPVLDNGKPYGRLRLANFKAAKKYHQAFGCSVHAYVPPGLKELAPELRYQLAQVVRMRHVPELHFHYDDSVDRGERIDALLKEDPPASE